MPVHPYEEQAAYQFGSQAVLDAVRSFLDGMGRFFEDRKS
jgi:hypothetical protein